MRHTGRGANNGKPSDTRSFHFLAQTHHKTKPGVPAKDVATTPEAKTITSNCKERIVKHRSNIGVSGCFASHPFQLTRMKASFRWWGRCTTMNHYAEGFQKLVCLLYDLNAPYVFNGRNPKQGSGSFRGGFVPATAET